MQRLSVLTVLAALALASGCATPWQKIQTKHVTLYTDMEPGYEEVLRSLEQGHAILASSFFSNAQLPQRVEVLFIDDVPFTSLFGTYRDGVALEKAPGSSGIGSDGLLVLRPMTAGRESEVSTGAGYVSHDQSTGTLSDTKGANITKDNGIAGSGISTNDRRSADANAAGRAAFEMLAHAYLQKAMPNAPLWFREAFANYVREARYNVAGDMSVACFGYVPKLAQNTVLLEPGKLWSASWDQYGSEYRSWLPFSGQMFIDYVISGDGGAHRDKLGTFVTALAEGKDAPATLNASFGWNDDALFTKLKEHVQNVKQLAGKTQARGDCPLGFRVTSSEMPDSSEPQKTEADQQKIQALMSALESVPDREGYQEYYPADVLERKPSGKKR